jgi:hypothetical protein
MKQHWKTILGLSLLGSLITQATLPVLAEEIDWQQVPGTLERFDGFGTQVLLIGTNTIARNGDAINFDLLEDMHFSYLRIAGNCRTGWMNSIASGYYNETGEVIIERRIQEPLQVQHDKINLSLQFACDLSK